MVDIDSIDSMEGWRAPAAFRARRREGTIDVRAAEFSPAQALSSISAIASHNRLASACSVGRRGGNSVLALYRASEAASDAGAGGKRGKEAAPRLQVQGKLIPLPGNPTAVAWCDETLACGTREGTVELLRLDGSSRDDESRARKVTNSLQPQWGAAASLTSVSTGTSSVVVGARDGRHARRIGAVVGACPCLWDAQTSGAKFLLSFGADIEARNASCLDLDWDKGIIAVGDLANNIIFYDARQSGAASKVQPAHFSVLNTVRCSPLHPHWVASGAADGLVKVWDMRRLDGCLFRLGWHVSAVSDVSWSWAHKDMLVSCAHDGTHRFWHLSLAPHFQLANADSAWRQRELVGCCMLPWPLCPLDSIAASSDGTLQAARVSSSRIMLPFARLIVKHHVVGLLPNVEAATDVSEVELEKMALQVTGPAVQRDLEAGGKALLSLLPALAKKQDQQALEAAERLLLMLISAQDLVCFDQHAAQCREELLAAPPPSGRSGWGQLLALHDKGGALDPSAGDIEDDALADESITLGLNDLEDAGDGEEGQGGSERQEPHAIEAMKALGEKALLEAVAVSEELLAEEEGGRRGRMSAPSRVLRLPLEEEELRRWQGSVLHVRLAENTELGARQGQELMQLGAGLKNAAIGGQGLEIIKLSTLGLTGTKTITLKAETKEEADGWIEILAKVQAGMSVAKKEKETPHAAAARQAAAAAADADVVEDVAATFAATPAAPQALKIPPPDATLPRRIGPARGVMQAMQDSHALPLAKALHMVRALRLAHPAQTLVTASWGELGTEGGGELLKPSSCRCILGVMSFGLHEVSGGVKEGVLGWGRGEEGQWVASLLPCMWQFSRWRTYALAARVTASVAAVASVPACKAYIQGLTPVFVALMRPTLMEEDARALSSQKEQLEANCMHINPWQDMQAHNLLKQELSRKHTASPSELGVDDVRAVLQDMSALALLHRFWVGAGGPAEAIIKRKKQRKESGLEMVFDTMRLDLSDEHAAALVSMTNPPGAPANYLEQVLTARTQQPPWEEQPAAYAKDAAGVSAVVCFRRWRALGVLELVVPLLFEISHVLLRELSAPVRQAVEDFVRAEVVGLVRRRIAVWTALNRARPWEYDKLAALLPAVTETLLDGLEKLASQLKYAMQQLTMRNNNDAAFTKEARQVCNKMEALIEEAITEAAEDEAVTLHERLGPLMAVIDQFI